MAPDGDRVATAHHVPVLNGFQHMLVLCLFRLLRRDRLRSYEGVRSP